MTDVAELIEAVRNIARATRYGPDQAWLEEAADELKALSERIAVLEALVQPAYEEGVEDGIDWQRSPCGEPQPQWIDSVARVDLLRATPDLSQ